jgi:uncharacterized protein YyaL (SSP411 family)
MAETASQHPSAFAGWLCATDFARGPQLQLAISGVLGDHQFQALNAVVSRRYLPNLVQAGGEPETDGLPALMLERPIQDDRATAYLCQGFACQLPTTDPDQLAEQLTNALGQVVNSPDT